MPYLAFELDALNMAPDVARAAGISEDTAIAGMARMWAYCWRSKTDRVTRVKVRGFFGADAAETLQDFGFLDPVSSTPTEFRVKGSGRYLRISQARSENGKRASERGNLKRGKAPPSAPEALQQLSSRPPVDLQQASSPPPNSAPALSSSIEHRIQKEETTAAVDIEPIRPPETAEAADAELNGDGNGNFPATPFGFYGWCQYERQLRGLTQEGDPPQKLLDWFAPAVTNVGGEDGLALAYTRYLDSPDFRATGWPFRVFMAGSVYRARGSEPPRRARL